MTVAVTDRVQQRAWWDDVLDWRGSVRAVAVLRIALGPITLLHLRPFLRDARAGRAYDDHFWHPYASWLPHLPGAVWFALLWIGAAAAVLMTVGLWTRVATCTAFAVVATNLLVSTTHFRHNRAFLMILLGAVALLPSGRVLSVDAWWRRRVGRAVPDVAWLWPLWLVRVQVCLVYLASGTSKLLDRDWIGGLVLWDRVVRYRHVLDPTPLPTWAIDLLLERWPYYVVGPVAVGIELFVGVGLLVTRTRYVAIWVAMAFHVLIEISASVEVFAIAAIAALAIWVRPVTREHVVTVHGGGAARLVAAALRAGDWFARFDVRRGDRGKRGVDVVGSDGVELTHVDAVFFVLCRLPLTFPLAAPARAARRIVRGRSATARSEQVAGTGGADGVLAAGDAELAVDRAGVRLDGVQRHVQLRGDLAQRQRRG
jgi:hypothetical protein